MITLPEPHLDALTAAFLNRQIRWDQMTIEEREAVHLIVMAREVLMLQGRR